MKSSGADCLPADLQLVLRHDGTVAVVESLVSPERWELLLSAPSLCLSELRLLTH